MGFHDHHARYCIHGKHVYFRALAKEVAELYVKYNHSTEQNVYPYEQFITGIYWFMLYCHGSLGVLCLAAIKVAPNSTKSLVTIEKSINKCPLRITLTETHSIHWHDYFRHIIQKLACFSKLAYHIMSRSRQINNKRSREIWGLDIMAIKFRSQ